jgi:hypothetical protein
MPFEVTEKEGLTRLEPTEADEAKAAILDLVAEGSHYTFLTVEQGEDASGAFLSVKITASMPIEIIRATLAIALEEIEAKLNSDK